MQCRQRGIVSRANDSGPLTMADKDSPQGGARSVRRDLATQGRGAPIVFAIDDGCAVSC